MKKDKNERKGAAGCLLIVALFFFVPAVYLCNEEKQERRDTQKTGQYTPATNSTDTITHTKRVSVGIFNPTANEDDEEEEDIYDDPYENPDFDDAFPGEEYDEEFIDRSLGDPELYHEPDYFEKQK